ncbi:hypothetical protein [Actinophytocola sp.]|uniref:hypothetical protein n=1 Tax=Actinophytocola sp. TaxID=1872138 RepID=UPI0038998ABC
MSWREERRRDRTAEAEQARANAVTAAEIAAIRERTRTQAVLAANAQQAQLRHEAVRERNAARVARKDAARQRRVRLLLAARDWLATRTVDLLIYPLAVVSALMAVPAMATFGHDVYGTAAGYALPVITELGMWAFAVAVQYTHRRHPDRPVWALQLGVWSFATVAAVLNAMHGLTRGVEAGVVMAVASVAGVVAHQLVTAAPRRSRADRDATRVARREARKIAAARRAAVQAAVAEIDTDGTARLVFAPGRYRLGTRWPRRGRLTPQVVSGLPVAPVLGSAWDALDRELADLVADPDQESGDRGVAAGDGGVATLDRDALPPVDRVDEQRKSSGTRKARSIDELRAELRARIDANPGSIDPRSAESIRRALRCSPARARQLRDDYQSDEKEV